MKTCPKCKCLCPDNVEYCVCGHKFNPFDSIFKNGNTDVADVFSQIFNTKNGEKKT